VADKIVRWGGLLVIAGVGAVIVIELLDSPPDAALTTGSGVQTVFAGGQPVDPATDRGAAYAPDPDDPPPVDPAAEYGRSQAARDQAAEDLGYYPAAPSKAGPMSPEWQSFAASVDGVCSVTYIYGLRQEARLLAKAQLKNWPAPQREAAVLDVWSDQGRRILTAARKLGPAPERDRLFHRWQANVAQRVSIRVAASEAYRAGDVRSARELCAQLGPLKEQADRIGQRFGLRVCTSN
jgi:hypothetical protein